MKAGDEFIVVTKDNKVQEIREYKNSLNPKLDYLYMYKGYDFLRDKDSDKCHIFLTLACLECHVPCSFNLITIKIKEDTELTGRGVGIWIGDIPTAGFHPFATGPSLCGRCIKLWREGKTENRTVDNILEFSR